VSRQQEPLLHSAYSICASFNCFLGLWFHHKLDTTTHHLGIVWLPFFCGVSTPLHTTTTQHTTTYISNGTKYCHKDISSGIASSKNDNIQKPRTHSLFGVWHDTIMLTFNHTICCTGWLFLLLIFLLCRLLVLNFKWHHADNIWHTAGWLFFLLAETNTMASLPAKARYFCPKWQTFFLLQSGTTLQHRLIVL